MVLVLALSNVLLIFDSMSGGTSTSRLCLLSGSRLGGSRLRTSFWLIVLGNSVLART